jgi:hypothetical protein
MRRAFSCAPSNSQRFLNYSLGHGFRERAATERVAQRSLWLAGIERA